MMRFINYWLPVILWMGVIFYFSSIPNLATHFYYEAVNNILRKIGHISEYGMLTLLYIRAIKGYHTRLDTQRVLEIAFLLALLYAITDEYHQLFVAGREGTFRDIAIDLIGASLVCLTLSIQQKKGR